MYRLLKNERTEPDANEGNMFEYFENWIGTYVSAFPDSEGAAVRGTLKGVNEHGVVIEVTSSDVPYGRGTKGPHFYAWSNLRWMHPKDQEAT